MVTRENVKTEEYSILYALETIIKNSDVKALNHCISYAKVAYAMGRQLAAKQQQPSHKFLVQLLYVKSNMQYWRGEEAKLCRAAINKLLLAGRTNGRYKCSDNRFYVPESVNVKIGPIC